MLIQQTVHGKEWVYYDRDTYKIIGSKSGTTNAAGHVFIATAADYEGHELICAYFGNAVNSTRFYCIRLITHLTTIKRVNLP